MVAMALVTVLAAMPASHFLGFNRVVGEGFDPLTAFPLGVGRGNR
jgi:hypothetical protein